MNNDPHEISTEDEGVDEDMMFEFEQELDARLTLAPEASASVSSSRSVSPISMYARPRNPVASVLQSANEIEEAEFASLSASPFADYGSPAATERMAAAIGSMSAPASIASGDKAVFFDFNGRRKRKFLDDSCCVTPRVRPLAKRAKSFSCVDQVLLPSSTSLTGAAAESSKKSSVVGQLFSAKRSDSIQIPSRVHRAAAAHAHRSSSGPARGESHQQTSAKPVELPAAASDPLLSQASSWNASVEYFCRRSLDISSPLRIRFRDLVVGSVGRAGSLQTP